MLYRWRAERANGGFGADEDLISTDLDFEYFDIHLCRPVDCFSGAKVKEGVVPGALDLAIFEASFRKRPMPVGAEFLNCEDVPLVASDGHDRTGNIDAQGLSFDDVGGDGNGYKAHSIRRRGRLERLLWKRRLAAMAADPDAVVVHEYAAQIAGDGDGGEAKQGEGKCNRGAAHQISMIPAQSEADQI